MEKFNVAALAGDPSRKAFSLLEEFKAFALKGNVIDLAVGVIIGASFAKIVDSLVKNLIMPLISLLMPSEKGYLEWKAVVAGKEIPYGLFLGDVLNFVIIAFVLFLFIVKFLGWILRTKRDSPAPPTKQEALLMEIRDLLKSQQALKLRDVLGNPTREVVDERTPLVETLATSNQLKAFLIMRIPIVSASSGLRFRFVIRELAS